MTANEQRTAKPPNSIRCSACKKFTNPWCNTDGLWKCALCGHVLESIVEKVCESDDESGKQSRCPECGEVAVDGYQVEKGLWFWRCDACGNDFGRNAESSVPDKVGDPVSHPAHYTTGPKEVIDAIIGLGWGRDFCRGNILKYVARYQKKNGVEDLRKAMWYLNRIVEMESGDGVEDLRKAMWYLNLLIEME